MCASKPAPACITATTFQCLAIGIFPDPTNCKKYYNCYRSVRNGPLVADAYTCDDGFVFDPSDPTKKNQFCRLTLNRFCSEITCPQGGTKNILMKYQYFPAALGQYVATCRAAPLTNLVTLCRANFEVDYTTAPVGCIFQCNKAVKAVFDEDNLKYNECKWNGKSWIASVEKCFQPGVFDPVKLACVSTVA